MKHTWTIIGVADVARSLKWYQALLGQPKTLPAHDDFGQIRDIDGTVLLCQLLVANVGQPEHVFLGELVGGSSRLDQIGFQRSSACVRSWVVRRLPLLGSPVRR